MEPWTYIYALIRMSVKGRELDYSDICNPLEESGLSDIHDVLTVTPYLNCTGGLADYREYLITIGGYRKLLPVDTAKSMFRDYLNMLEKSHPRVFACEVVAANISEHGSVLEFETDRHRKMREIVMEEAKKRMEEISGE